MTTKSAGTGPKATPADDNRSRQLNDQNDAYWQSRGEPGRPPADGTDKPAAEPAPPEKK